MTAAYYLKDIRAHEPAEYYDLLCKSTNFSWKASGWESEEDQYGRFLLTSSVVKKESSVLDVGCGQGDLYTFLQQRMSTSHKPFSYTGIDVSEKMIGIAKSKHPNVNFSCVDFLTQKEDQKYDHVFALGTFSLRAEDQDQYITSCISKCFRLTNHTCTITITSETSETKYDEIFYYKVSDIAKTASSLSKKIVINTASSPCEIILTLYK